MSSTHYYFLNEPSADHALKLGKKAFHLRSLKNQGFSVPDGFVIPHDFDTPDFTRDLTQAVAQIGGWPVAVRSSGVLEDLEGISFAGQYESFLNVDTIEELISCIYRCRASATSDQVRAYLEKNKLPLSQAKVSALVQKMVPAKFAGVGFSIHPLTGKEENALIEVCEGLGDKLVGGSITPTTYVVDLPSKNAVEKQIGSSELTTDQIQNLTSLILEIQAYFGCPQDIEWAIDQSGKIWILQSRPITKVHWRTDIEAYSNADLKDGGVSARVCTPLMFSLYRNASQESMQEYFEDIRLIKRNSKPDLWMTYFYGRVYWNVSAVKRVMLRIPGFDEAKFDHDLGIERDYDEGGPVRVPMTLPKLIGALPVAIALEKFYQNQLSATHDFGHPFAEQRAYWIEKTKNWANDNDTRFFADLRSVFQDFHLPTEETYFRTVSSNSNAQSEFKSFLTKMDQATGKTTSIIRLFGGLENVVHMEMQKHLLKLHEIAKNEGFYSQVWNEELESFLAHHGFHSDAELDLTVPRWSEDSSRIQEMILGMLQSGVVPKNPETSVQQQKELFLNELNQVEGALHSPWLRLRFKRGFYKHLKRTRDFLSSREQMREYSTQCYAIVRLAILEAARRLVTKQILVQPEDIFMLHVDEILSLAQEAQTSLNDTLANLIQYRRQIYLGYRNFSAPNEVGQGASQRSQESYVQELTDQSILLKGIGCSAGKTEGIARIVESVHEIHSIQKNDILITRFTDPSWTPVLGLVTGIVTEVGGLLSHAAVISREYGIPAILNLSGATRRIKSGQRIRIDGMTGVVEVFHE